MRHIRFSYERVFYTYFIELKNNTICFAIVSKMKILAGFKNLTFVILGQKEVTKAEFMQCLGSLERLLIRAKYHSDQLEVSNMKY